MIRFTARLPVMRTDKPRYFVDDGGNRVWDKSRSENNLPPYPNPTVEKLRKKLTKQKVPFTEETDGNFIIFKSVLPKESNDAKEAK